ncbi:MAG: DegT/DnrJ/EryC1/StrS family aminotransferase [Pseudomonadota bacterium]
MPASTMTDERIALARPWLGDEEQAALSAVLHSNILSRGNALLAFEKNMARLAGTDAAVGVNSGTSAIQIALEALDIQPGDEVITVSYTFIGTLNAITRAGATPVLVDIDPATLNIDPKRLAEALTDRTRAIVVVHLFGRPAPIDEIRRLIQGRPIRIIEDACEAIGARYRGRPAGGLADAGTFGFYPNKPVATGEGGMITASDPDFITRCRQLRNQGLDPLTGQRHPTRAGLSARLSELQAAVGTVQLQRLEQSLNRRERLAEAYIERLSTLANVELPAPAEANDRISWFTFPLRVIAAERRDALRDFLAEQQIETGLYFQPAHHLPPYRDAALRHSLATSEDIGQRCLALPLHPVMDMDQLDRICSAIVSFFKR